LFFLVFNFFLIFVDVFLNRESKERYVDHTSSQNEKKTKDKKERKTGKLERKEKKLKI
jgi:hypothetical protein